jgi:hypothetical protein
MTTEDLTGMGKAIAPLTEGVFKLCSKLLSKPADQGGDILDEWIDVRLRPWRLKNLLRSLEKTNEILVRYGAEPRPISNHKLLSEFFDGASLENDETLQQLWAGLLATELLGQESHPAYPRILRELTPSEARILNILFLNGEKSHSTTTDVFVCSSAPLDSLLTQESFSENLLLLASANLCRLNLCDLEPKKSLLEHYEEAKGSPSAVPVHVPKFDPPDHPFSQRISHHHEIYENFIQLSRFGYAFVQACNP